MMNQKMISSCLRIDHILSNIPEISDPSQLCADRDLFQDIVEEYQLEQYGPVIYELPEDPPIEDEPLPDNFSMVYSLLSMASGASTKEHSPHSSDLPEPDSSEESPQMPMPARKGKWRVKSLFWQAITNLVEVFKWCKVSSKL